MTDATPTPDDPLLREQAEYYRARAGEYDDWWRRIGRYDRGPEATARWNAEVAEVAAALDRAPLTGDVLELASGTGWWTERLARTASRLTCIDASPETIEINRARLRSAGLPEPRYAVADLFAWTPDETYDAVFFSFWLSHVPEDRFEAFWSTVARALKPGGRAYLVDSLPDLTSTANNHVMPDADGLQERKLDDSRSYRIVKRFREAGPLADRLAMLGWTSSLASTSHYFVHGAAWRA